jgi:hypothetical protein
VCALTRCRGSSGGLDIDHNSFADKYVNCKLMKDSKIFRCYLLQQLSMILIEMRQIGVI